MMAKPRRRRIVLMTRVALIAAAAVLVTSCSDHGDGVISVAAVKQTLRAAQLGPQRVKLVTTIETATRTPLPAVNFCAAEAVAVPSATSLDVDQGRAIVMVFESPQAADAWTPRAECAAKPLRVRNVIAVPIHGHPSRRLRQALHQLRGSA